MPREDKRFPWAWRSLIFVAAFPNLFYLCYVWPLAFSWKRLLDPWILGGAVVVLDGIDELFVKSRRIRLARTDWVERIARTIVFTVAVLGFICCAVLGKYIALREAIALTLCWLIVAVFFGLIRGMYDNDRQGPSDGTQAPPENMPLFAELLFPSDRTKRQ